MAHRIIVQDGVVLYRSSDPGSLDLDFSVIGSVNVTNQINIGDVTSPSGLLSTFAGSGADLKIETHNDGFIFGNIELDNLTDGGSILLNNIAWPDGTVSPIPGMYLGVSALNTLQFYVLPAGSTPAYELISSLAAQTVFNTVIPTIANGINTAHLQVFVNGVKEIEGALKSYLVTGANQITFNAGLNLNDDVEFYAFT
jgi:hypothetical protein